MALLLQNRSQRLNQRIILAVVIFMAPIVGMGIDSYTPSLPAISTYFDVRGLYVKLTLFTYLNCSKLLYSIKVRCFYGVSIRHCDDLLSDYYFYGRHVFLINLLRDR